MMIFNFIAQKSTYMQMADILAQMGGGGGGGYASDGAKAVGEVSLDGPRQTTTPIPFIDNPGGSKNSVTNCREFVFNTARSPQACMSVKQKDIAAGMVKFILSCCDRAPFHWNPFWLRRSPLPRMLAFVGGTAPMRFAFARDLRTFATM